MHLENRILLIYLGQHRAIGKQTEQYPLMPGKRRDSDRT